MSSIIRYTPEENFRRLRRQKSLKFVVVEGSDDLPIFESVLNTLNAEKIDFDIFFAGGKEPIKKFLEEHTPNNSVFIVDKDFDEVDELSERVISLTRYSIENFFICEEVICSSLQYVLKCKYEDAKELFSLEEFLGHIEEATEYLVKVLFYYQRKIVPELIGEEKVSWSDKFLCENSSWKLCEDKIEALIESLLNENIEKQQIEDFFDQYFRSTGSAIKDFPGKMLKYSLQRFIRDQLVQINPKLKGKFNDVENMSDSLSSTMHRSSDLKSVLDPVLTFLKS